MLEGTCDLARAGTPQGGARPMARINKGLKGVTRRVGG